MASTVHGWRLYHVKKALVMGGELPILVGMRQVMISTAKPPAAVCLGFDPYAMWIAEETREMPSEERHPKGTSAPQLHCTCGVYGHRLWPENRPDPGNHTSQSLVFAHVTCLGPVVIHAEGWRAAAYVVDYIIPVRHVEEPFGKFILYKYGPPAYENVWFDEVVRDIAKRLDVPLLPFDSPDACEECAEANRDAKTGPSWQEAYISGQVPAGRGEGG
jgi:hypothetical protein